MAVSYLRRGMTSPATFSLFARRLPPDRGFLIAAGREDCLAFLEQFSLTTARQRFAHDLAWLPARHGNCAPQRPYPLPSAPALSALRQRLASRLRPSGATPVALP